MKQVFFKFENNELVPLLINEKKLFDAVSDYRLVEEIGINDELFVSFKNEHKEKDIGVCLWSEQFAITVKYKELIKLLEFIKDEQRLKALISAEAI